MQFISHQIGDYGRNVIALSSINIISFYIEDAFIIVGDTRYDLKLKLNMKKEFISILTDEQIYRYYIEEIQKNIKYSKEK